MSGDAGRFPAVPDGRLDGWTRTDAFSETVFELSAVSVEGHTVIYEDDRLRTAVREATGVDRMWRFFFATRLEFSPPLPPGVGPMAVFSTVASQADDRFVDILAERGFRSVSRGRRERVRVETGGRARLRKYTAVLDVDAGDDAIDLQTAGMLAVWTVDGEFRLAGGAYPSRPLADVLRIEDSGVDELTAAGENRFREDLLGVIRAVR
ncbi:hypothetical protein [Halorientalis marina]|uniref:hypothetical protein n=1 Tax=Halorientalis marina TaxID=2931976 RepID=UPI001FF15810|nr:hypothetical protein [Halorientalis marina]